MKRFIFKLLKTLLLNLIWAFFLWAVISLVIIATDPHLAYVDLLPIYPFVYFVMLSLALSRFEKKYLS